MAFCLIAITILYILERQSDSHNHSTPSMVDNSHNVNHTPQPQHGGLLPSNASITAAPAHSTAIKGQNTSATTFSAHMPNPTGSPFKPPIIIYSYPPCTPPNCESQCCPPPFDDDPHTYTHSVIISGSGNRRRPVYDVIEENHTEKNNTQQGSSSVRQSGNELPGQNPIVTFKPESNHLPDSGQVVINDSTLNDQPQVLRPENGNINTNQINVVYRRRRRSTQANLIPTIVLKELNLTLGMHHCVMCGINNYTFNATLCPNVQFEPITLQFKTKPGQDNFYVYKCYNQTLKHCPHDQTSFNEEEITTPGQTEFKLPVGKFFESHYRFRVTRTAITDVCGRPALENYNSFAEFSFNFHRTCSTSLCHG